MSTKSMTALVAALALAGVGLAACGDDDDTEEPAPPPPAATQPAQPDTGGTKAREAVEVAADPGGKLVFEQSSLSTSGGSVTFEFTNEADVPHDFTIERDGKKLAGTEVITASEDSVTVDLKAGSYTYYCSVDGHRGAGMEGALTVK